jgi:hypothetical protein
MAEKTLEEVLRDGLFHPILNGFVMKKNGESVDFWIGENPENPVFPKDQYQSGDCYLVPEFTPEKEKWTRGGCNSLITMGRIAIEGFIGTIGYLDLGDSGFAYVYDIEAMDNKQAVASGTGASEDDLEF